MITNKHMLAILLVKLCLFGQIVSAHNLFVEPQTLLETPLEAPAEDDFSFAAPFQIENVIDSQSIFSYLTPGEIDVFEFEVTQEDLDNSRGGALLVTATALPPSCQETINNYPVTVLMGPGLPAPSVDLPFDVPPDMGVIIVNNPKIEPANKRPIFNLDTADPQLNLGIGFFLPKGLTQECLLTNIFQCDFSNHLAQAVFLPGIYNIIMYDPSDKAQDYIASIGLSEDNFVPNPELEDLVRNNGLLHTACSEILSDLIPGNFPIYSSTRLKANGGNDGNVYGVFVNQYGVANDEIIDNSRIDSNGNLDIFSQLLPELVPSTFPLNESNLDVKVTTNTLPFEENTASYFKQIEIEANQSAHFTGGGPFHIDRLKMKEGATLELAAGTYFINQLDMTGGDGMRIKIISEPVKLHIGEMFTISGQRTSINAEGNVSGLVVYLHKDAQFQAKEVDSTGLIYGPENKSVQMENMTLRGAVIVGGEIELKTGVDLVYTEEDREAVSSIVITP